MEVVDREGRAIAYVAAGSGPGMVLVHGWCSDRSAFEPQLAHFARSHRVVALDLAGHGLSDRADSYRIVDFADDVVWLTRHLGLDRPVVIGHSLGGMIAVEAAASNPDLFVAAVALDAPIVHDQGLVDGVRLQLEIFGGSERETAGPEFLRTALWGPHDDHERAERIVDAMMAVPSDVALPSLAEVAEWPARQRLLDCRQPVLCIHIRGGGPTDPTALAGEHPDVHIAQTVGAGHFIQLEVPDQVHAMVERFLTVAGVQTTTGTER